MLDAIKMRRSIRQFTNQQVSQEQIAQIIEAGRLTPSGGNLQDVSFIVLKDDLVRFEKHAVRLFKLASPYYETGESRSKTDGY